MLIAENLSRRYGDFLAVDDVSFQIGSGEVVGLLGHNGAGKTTIMKMLTGFLEPSAGRVIVDGEDLALSREAGQAKMGYLPENCPIYPEMTVLDFLDFAAELRGGDPARREQSIYRAIDATSLFEKAAEPIGALSRGLRQRVGVAQAIIHDPQIVILDEPTNGLDPGQIQQMRALIRRLAERATVILSTHILQEAQAVCDRVLMINRGRLALDTPLAELGARGAVRVAARFTAAQAASALAAVQGANVTPVSETADVSVFDIMISGVGVDEIAPRAARALVEAGAEILSLAPARRDLEALFAEVAAGDAVAAAPTSSGEAAHASA